ncbi:Small ribosomal subunit biogenesis [Malassezia psittaci]|uniref:Small ribosomal subunit biogenesis n=1 Tax=Malassezia psittaci TaxID=1821823 RepID=A0AAF0JE33_9BASI|nr:Small ribosomal subunit biogenesis [Malassezia psittaci]
MSATHEPARAYVISGGANAGTSDGSYNTKSLPEILRSSDPAKKRKKRRSAIENDRILSRIELIQDFEFPEASNKVRFTRDGLNIMATGTYKPQIRVWDCEQLSLKYERHTNAENVDFQILSDDWTKSLHLQSDRSLELQGQGGILTSIRLPRFGRALGYHYPSADALVGGSTNEVYRFNLHQGQYLAPYSLGQRGNLVNGCNAIDVNPAHGLLSFGTDGEGVVELWDPRMRQQAGALSIATQTVLDAALLASRRQLPGLFGKDAENEALSRASQSLATTALSSAEDGLNMAVGTNTGHILLFDLRMDKPYLTKDQGFGLPVHSLSWTSDRNAAAAAGNIGADTHARLDSRDTVLSADAKVVKVWAKESGENLVSISPPTPTTNLNDVQQYPGSGLIFATVEATQMAAWYVPALGPAPRWCSFVDNVTDEIDTADAMGTGANTNAYEDFKFVDQPELERLDLTHLIGTPLLRPYMHGYFLALRLYERARLMAHPTAYQEAKKRAIQAKIEREAESRVRSVANASKPRRNVQVNKELAERLEKGQTKHKEDKHLLEDERFKELFTNPEYQVDETSREYAMLNPSSAPTTVSKPALRESSRQTIPAIDEELESDRESLDPDQEDALEREKLSPPSSPEPIPHARPPKVAKHTPRLLDSSSGALRDESSRTMGERAKDRSSLTNRSRNAPSKDDATQGAVSVSWTPSAAPKRPKTTKSASASKKNTFGMGLSKGADAEQGYGADALNEEARFGRTQRRKPGRSASRNVMRSTTQ